MMRPGRQFALLALGGVLSSLALFVPPAWGQSRVAGSDYGQGLPAFCRVDHRARGAAIGAAVGEARGGQRGAQIGAAIGAARGERIDALCRHIATFKAARPTREPPANMPGAAAQQPRPAMASASAPAPLPARQSPGEYLPRYDQLSQAVAPLTDAAPAPERCMATLEVSFAPQDAPASPVAGQVCEGADGKLREKN
jgi:hypothetical protein